MVVPCSLSCTAAEKDVASEGTMKGKVYAGYQGWFGTPGDGSGAGFEHYRVRHKGGPTFEPGYSAIDLWPDLSEFDEDEKYPTPFKHADGSTAYVFSSAKAKTVDRHFKWMKDYGIDGVFLQRFIATLKSNHKRKHRDRVFANVRASADKHGREWAIMYDLSGVDNDDIRKYLVNDFKQQVDANDPRKSSNYIRHNGKPVVAVWGVGFGDDRDYDLTTCLEIVRFLKNDPVYGDNAVMLGVPYYWRIGERDAVDDPLLNTIIKEADIISPWSVGRYKKPSVAEKRIAEQVRGDLESTNETDTAYLPVIFPGFSWQNLQKSRGVDADLASIPRLGGEFLWAQASTARQAGAEMVYIAMFDEMDEGTAIMKCTNDPPVGKSNFLTYDGLPSDHYLWLSGQIGRLFRGELRADAPMPKRND